MRETYMHVAGIVATDPTIRTFDDGRQVMSFRVASTSRRYDTASKAWVDGQTLWVKVSCWRELAANAAECVRKRDRVVAWGRVRTEQWKGEDGGHRSDLALEAEALGHDLTFGVATFVRRRRAVSTRTLTPDGVLDLATGELVPRSPDQPEVPELPAGLVDAPDVVAARPPAPPPGTGSGDDDVLEELDEGLDDDLDEELDGDGTAADGLGQGVSVLASA
jgi:single-strand DNA-binding protein